MRHPAAGRKLPVRPGARKCSGLRSVLPRGNQGSPMRAGHVLALVFLLGCASRTPSGGAAVPRTANPQEIVAAPDRTERDRAMDEHRKPVEMLTFFELGPGMRVAELGAGGGYTTELLARAVGPTSVVFAQDTPNWDGP